MACLLGKHSFVSVTSAHGAGVQGKSGTYRDKALGAPPAEGSTQVTQGLVSAGHTGLELVHQEHSTSQGGTASSKGLGPCPPTPQLKQAQSFSSNTPKNDWGPTRKRGLSTATSPSHLAPLLGEKPGLFPEMLFS